MSERISSYDFHTIADLVKSRSGIVLNEDKGYLVESRLSHIARKYACKTLNELTEKIRRNPDETLLSAITDAMTTNESLFFRDIKPFEQLRDLIVPSILNSRRFNNRIKIWSAASSTGQEAYSIAITLLEMSEQCPGMQTSILGTDISDEAINRARSGEYSQFEIQRGMPINLLTKYFDKESASFTVKNNIKKMVTFSRFNLLDSPSKFGKFDIIFLRNVLIYFDIPTKRKVLEGIRSVLSDDGFLVLGGTESTLGITETLETVPDSRGIYQLKSSSSQYNSRKTA